MIGIGFAAGMTLAQKALRIAIGAAAVVSLCGLSYCQGRTDGANGVLLADEKARNEQLQESFEAGERAAEQRIADALKQQEVDEIYEDAIDAAPGGVNSPAAIALACQRLRRAGYSGADLPAKCRSGIGYGAEAAAGAGDRN